MTGETSTKNGLAEDREGTTGGTEESVGDGGVDASVTSVDATEIADLGEPPGPDGYPIVGNTLQITRDPFGFLDDLANYGDVVRYRIVGNTVTALLHPDYIQRVLVEESDRFERYLFSDKGFDFAPEGILFTGGQQWHDQRQIMQPAFTMERIQSYAETMRSATEEMAATWDDGDEIVLNQAFSTLTLQILTKALFDIDVDPDEESEAVIRAARVINEQSNSRSVAAFIPRWVPTLGNRRYRKAMDAYRERVDELIEGRRDTKGGVARDVDQGANATEGQAEVGDDLLSILLNADGPDGNGLSEAEIRDNLITFTFAGHETSSLALTYTFQLLATHDDVRKKLDDELESVLGGSVPGFEHVRDLEYTDQIITETMRLYPPAFLIFRKATEDTVIGGYEIPEGSVLTLPQYRIHRDERFYDDPDQFRPERWTDEFEAALPEYAHFPFGGGPRHCIGMRFAMLELKLVVATLAQRFEFDLRSDPELELDAGATLQPAADVRMRVRRRE